MSIIKADLYPQKINTPITSGGILDNGLVGQVLTKTNTGSLWQYKDDYSSFKVWASDIDITRGQISAKTTEQKSLLSSVYGQWVLDKYIYENIPANKQEIFDLRVTTSIANCDIIIDWGDGNIQDISSNIFEFVGPDEYGIISVYPTHTYASAGVYLIKIYGKDYYQFSHATGSTRKTYNLVCQIFTAECKLASHIINGSGMFPNSQKLLRINAPYLYPLSKIKNCAYMFSECHNLYAVENISVNNNTNIDGMFRYCVNLRTSSVTIPSKIEHIYRMYDECKKLSGYIEYFFDTKLFGNIDIRQAFRDCKALSSVSIPANYLWEDSSVIFNNGNILLDDSGSNQNGIFYDCSDAIRAQVPTSWGGTNIQIQEKIDAGYWNKIEKYYFDDTIGKINTLLSAVIK